jgi:hypothetical protein
MSRRNPEKYREVNEQTFNELCLETTKSPHGMRHICKQLGVCADQMWKFVHANEEYIKQYARSKEEQADTMADEIIEIANEPVKNDSSAVNRNRLRVDTLKWIASKLKPKKYGDDLDTGKGTAVQMPSEIRIVMVEPKAVDKQEGT